MVVGYVKMATFGGGNLQVSLRNIHGRWRRGIAIQHVMLVGLG